MKFFNQKLDINRFLKAFQTFLLKNFIAFATIQTIFINYAWHAIKARFENSSVLSTMLSIRKLPNENFEWNVKILKWEPQIVSKSRVKTDEENLPQPQRSSFWRLTKPLVMASIPLHNT